jgi:tetratricopeptide (TPR) repeat protein
MKLFFQIILKIVFILTLLVGCATTEEIKENDPVALVKQSTAFIEEGQNDRAITYCNKAIEINPSYAEAYYNRGRSYHRKHKYDKAISDFNRSIELNPKDWVDMAYTNRGVTYEEKGQYDKAISDFNKAIEINPMDFMAYNNLAWILATCPDDVYRDGVKAVELAEKAVEHDPIASRLDTLAAAFAELGRFEDAIITQEKVIVLLKKEGKPRNLIEQCIERLKFYKAHKPWRA